MIKNVVLMALITLFVGIGAVSAQDKKPDYSGTWELDVAKSKLGDRARIEAMTLTVSQTATEFKETSTTKRTPRPEGDAPQGGGNGGGRPGGGGGGGMGRGGMMGGGGGEMNATYTLDGKETTVQQDSPMGQMPVKLKAGFEKDGKLKLNSSRTINSPAGEISITTKETWTLSTDGKILTVSRDMETPRGSNSTEMVFVKK